jgi:hypothetical protein
MKKNFLGLVALPVLALLATSCAQETVETKSGNVLSYGVATGKQVLSRAELTEKNDLYGGFSVDLYYTAGGVFSPSYLTVKSTDEGATWGYGSVVYHPAAGLSHFAFYPLAGSNAVKNFTTPGSAILNYASQGDVDLVAAAAQTTQDEPEASIIFKHILSQINFKVAPQKSSDNIIAEVGKITLSGVNNAGYYTLSSATNEGTWAQQYGADLYTDTYDLALMDAVTGAYDVSADGGLMLMPQTLPSGAKFSFTYTLKSADTGIVIGEGQSLPAEASLAGQVWDPGLKYTYIISFEGPAVIKYTVDVNGWENANPQPGAVEIPEYEAPADDTDTDAGGDGEGEGEGEVAGEQPAL